MDKKQRIFLRIVRNQIIIIIFFFLNNLFSFLNFVAIHAFEFFYYVGYVTLPTLERNLSQGVWDFHSELIFFKKKKNISFNIQLIVIS